MSVDIRDPWAFDGASMLDVKRDTLKNWDDPLDAARATLEVIGSHLAHCETEEQALMWARVLATLERIRELTAPVLGVPDPTSEDQQ